MTEEERKALTFRVAAYLLSELRWRDVVDVATDMGLHPSAGDVDWVEDALVAAAKALEAPVSE